MSGALTYVYGLVRSARQPPLRGVPAGMPGGGPVRLIPAGDRLWLVVSSVSPEAYGDAAIARGLSQIDWVSRRALAHEAVVEHFLAAPALLPMQLFTLFASDARALASIAAAQARIRRSLDRLERRVEWGLRLGVDPAAVATAARSPGEGPTSGTRYLAGRRDALRGARRRMDAAAAAAERIYHTASRAAVDARRRPVGDDPAGSRLVLDAAFLVETRRTRAFRSAIAAARAAARAGGLTLTLSGPWPAYHFVPRGHDEATKHTTAVTGATKATTRTKAVTGATKATKITKAVTGTARATKITKAVTGATKATKITKAVNGATKDTKHTTAVTGPQRSRRTRRL